MVNIAIAIEDGHGMGMVTGWFNFLSNLSPGLSILILQLDVFGIWGGAAGFGFARQERRQGQGWQGQGQGQRCQGQVERQAAGDGAVEMTWETTSTVDV